MRRVGRTVNGRAREIPALLFALVWVLGFELLPTAHLAAHALLPAHTHGATHCHGGVCHEDGGPRDGAAAGEDPIAHGAGSLEHRGVAALAPDVAIVVPEFVAVAEIATLTAPIERVSTFESSLPPSRGPPA